MKFLMDHGEKVVTAAIVLLCGVFIFMNLQPVEDPANADLLRATETVNSALEKNSVNPQWEWSSQRQLKYTDRFTAQVKRADEPVRETFGVFSFYPQPKRPYVDPQLEPSELPKTVVEETAVLKPPAEFSARADHPCVYISYRLGDDVVRRFHPVRIEIYRGLAADKVDEKIADVYVGPEEEELDHLVGETEPAKPKEEPKVKPKEGGTARESADTKDESPPDAEKVEIPPEFKKVQAHKDFNIAPRKTYFYKARLVGRLIRLEPGGIKREGDKGIKVKIPPDLTPVPPAKEGSTMRLYASPYTAVVSDTTPPSFILRFAGSLNELPPEGKLFQPGTVPDYRGKFAVKAWVPPVKNWLECYPKTEKGEGVGVGEEIKVHIRYQKEDKTFDFFDRSTGYELVEIKNAIEHRMIKKMVSVTVMKADENGVEHEEAVMDEKTGQPKKVEKEIDQPNHTQVATIREIATGKTEDFFIRKDFEKQKDAFIALDLIYKRQEKKEQEDKERIKKYLEGKKGK